MIEKIITKSGITIIADQLENDLSFTLGVFVKTGSKDEASNEEGLSHLIEHMMFKGTEKRKYFELSEETDFLGASSNANTSIERTLYYMKSLSEYQEKISDILFDMCINSTFSEEELEKEKDVVIEEIKMYEDSPEDLVFELAYKNNVKGQIGKPIIGTVESVKGFTRDDLLKYYVERYTKDNMVIVMSGKFDKELLINQVEQYFSEIKDTKIKRHEEIEFDHIESKLEVKKDINQVNIHISTKSLKSTESKDTLMLYILSSILGGSMSSRLFFEIREKQGLAYSVYCFNQSFEEGGVFNTYIGTSKENYKKAIDITIAEFEKLKKEGITEKELQKTKNTYASKMAFNINNNSNRMNLIGSCYLNKEKIWDPNELLNIIESITVDEVNELAKKVLKDYSITILGNI